ncbi:DNA topoisomerase family protein [Bibersteinia trehalosi]|uniref:DNA topoisomerase type IA zn finger domain-containing protein n=1 Tax=Bibersteinia trehalosi USDA-ARS-USMARC-190 TaxID=1263832 RepID=W0R889_BIBTR|nr:topoisomerase DNA-binding C4 zinc finger domain-containing protein [Bibersteinia trehalosi]AHG86996.1 hypothetical protein F544_17680 [Bibersteinia trehalosi USDA-ARS-USMARC-190]
MSLFESSKQREICPECGAMLQIKRGKQGLFLGCSAYPQCHYIKPLQQSYHIIKTLDEPCPDCNALLQLKQGSFGIFIGCSDYPNCRFVVHEQVEQEEEFDCPECSTGKLVKRTGRSGKAFYACNAYPKCKFTLAIKPVKRCCPECNYPLALAQKQQYQCANKLCQHIFNEKPNDNN